MALLKCITTGSIVEIGTDDFLVGRNPQADFVVRDPACSRDHFRVKRDVDRYWMELSLEKAATLNGTTIIEKTPLLDGDQISVGNTLLVFENPTARNLATQAGDPVTPSQLPSGSSLPPLELPVGMKVTLGRERQLVTRHLDHVQVSRCHAQLLRKKGKVTISDLGSSNGTYVNGRRIQHTYELTHGDRIDIGPYCFEFLGDCLEPSSTLLHIDLNCVDLTRNTRKSGTTILKNVRLSIRPGEFVCIIGPSGAGKSTLLRAMSNRENGSHELSRTGTVLLNDRDLFREFDRLKGTLAVVPQHEVLHEQLRLRTALYYAARLRLPADTGRGDLQRRIDEVLAQVQLSDRKNTKISQLSGGERKRAALATEMIAEPNLLFLDEVTSGLDELTDSELMSLFRAVANDGKTVICVTHTLACVARDCDLVVALTRFGRLAFVGKPAEALEYFGVNQLTGAYETLAVANEDAADAYAESFLGTEYAQRYVHDRLKAWSHASKDSAVLPKLRPQRPRFRARVSQFGILSRRYARLLFANRSENVVRVVQCLLVAGLLCSVFGDISANVPYQLQCGFLVALSCYWFGCNNAAKELVKERNVYSQERDVSLNATEYLASKITLLAGVSCLQAWVLVGLVRYGVQLPGSSLAWVTVMSAVAIAGATAGVAISAWSSNEEVAIGFVPIWLIPQIILGDAIVALDGVNEFVAKMAISLFHGVEGTNTLLTDDVTNIRSILVLAAHSVIAIGIAWVRLARR